MCYVKNNFLKIKKNIILMHFGVKKHFKKQPQPHFNKKKWFSNM